MSADKPKTKKTVKMIKKLRPVEAEKSVVDSFTSIDAKSKKSNLNFVIKLLIILVIGTGIYFLAQKYRGLFLAGMVNNSPVTRWELNQNMAGKYGKQTFEEIVSERLLEEALRKNGIKVTDQQTADELAKIKQQYGGEEAFQQAILQFGLSEAAATKSIKQSLGLKLLIEKNNKIEITDEAVSKYFADNEKTYTGKKLEEVSTEIKDLLYQQEVYTKSQEWFTQTRKDAKVTSFI